MDAIVYVHAPISDDAQTLRLVQFRHPDGFDAIPFFTSLDKAQAASSSAVRILGVSGRELLTGWRISKDGGFELNGNTPDGYKLRVVNQGVYVYHPNGVPAVEVGVLL